MLKNNKPSRLESSLGIFEAVPKEEEEEEEQTMGEDQDESIFRTNNSTTDDDDDYDSNNTKGLSSGTIVVAIKHKNVVIISSDSRLTMKVPIKFVDELIEARQMVTTVENEQIVEMRGKKVHLIGEFVAASTGTRDLTMR